MLGEFERSNREACVAGRSRVRMVYLNDLGAKTLNRLPSTSKHPQVCGTFLAGNKRISTLVRHQDDRREFDVLQEGVDCLIGLSRLKINDDDLVSARYQRSHVQT